MYLDLHKIQIFILLFVVKERTLKKKKAHQNNFL